MKLSRLELSWILAALLMAAALPAASDPSLPVAAAGWRVEVVAEAPRVVHPSVVAGAPDGRVFVAEDPMDIRLPKADAAEGRVLCVHPDGRITVFAEGLHAVFGMEYLEGSLHVLHNPRWTVFADGGDSQCGRRDLIEETLPEPWALNWNDHVPAGFHLAMDGYFYVSTGDKGLRGAAGRDGSRIEMSTGGIFRLRPDGTGLEVFATGMRNILDVAVNDEDELFTYDNTDERDWWSRLAHLVDGGEYGYPYDFNPLKPWALPPMADYGGGAATGALAYEEDALPEEYRGNLFLADFGRRQVMRLRIERDGATWRVASREEDLLSGPPAFRPVGIAVSADGLSLYVCDWKHLDTKEDVKVGRLLKVTWTGPVRAAPKPAWWLDAALGKPCTAPLADLLAGLRHPARSVRLCAQRRLIERGAKSADPLARLVADRSAPAAARRHALWALDAVAAGGVAEERRAIREALLDGDPSIRRQSARALGGRRALEAAPALAKLLWDADAAVRFQAATALGRLGKEESVPALLNALQEKDRFARLAVFTALARIGRSSGEAWSGIARGLRSPSPEIREGTLLAMRECFSAPVVAALIEYCNDRAVDGGARAATLETLAGLHHRPAARRGEWWGYHPVDLPRPERTLEWRGTPAILAMLRGALGDPDPRVRSAAVRGIREARDRGAVARLGEIFEPERNAEIQASILEALGALGGEGAGEGAVELAAKVLEERQRDPRVLLAAISVGETGVAGAGGRSTAGADRMAPPLRRILLEVEADPAVRRAAARTLGQWKRSEALPELARALVSPDELLRAEAAVSIGAAGGAEAGRLLERLLVDPSVAVRRTAIHALGERKERSAIPALLEAFAWEETRSEAAAALARMPDLRALDAIIFGLGSPDFTLRDGARKALASMAREALPPLEERLAAGKLPIPAHRELRKIYGKDPAAAASPLMQTELKEIPIDEYLATALKGPGDPAHGRKLFEDRQGVGCIRCHRASSAPAVGASGKDPGGDLGPDLSTIGSQYGRRELAESVLDPSRVIRDAYRQEILELRTGEIVPGVVKAESGAELIIQTTDGEKRRIARAQVRDRRATELSIMPEGLPAGLTLEEFADLIAFLESLKTRR